MREGAAIDSFSVLLVVLSAAIHPLRDIGLKGISNPLSAYLGVCVGWIVFAGLHTLLAGRSMWLPPDVWPVAIVSALGLCGYYYGTLAALQRGPISIYYPIIRSSPLAVVALNWGLFGHAYSAFAILGVLTIILAGYLIQKPSGAGIGDRLALGFALVAMLGSATYTLADSVAMRAVAAEPFLMWVYAIVALLLGALGIAGQRRDQATTIRQVLTESWLVSPGRLLFASATSYASYYLILRAFQLGADPAYASALRQISIPVSVLLAAVAMQEPMSARRFGWSLLLMLGVWILLSG